MRIASTFMIRRVDKLYESLNLEILVELYPREVYIWDIEKNSEYLNQLDIKLQTETFTNLVLASIGTARNAAAERLLHETKFKLQHLMLLHETKWSWF